MRKHACSVWAPRAPRPHSPQGTRWSICGAPHASSTLPHFDILSFLSTHSHTERHKKAYTHRHTHMHMHRAVWSLSLSHTHTCFLYHGEDARRGRTESALLPLKAWATGSHDAADGTDEAEALELAYALVRLPSVYFHTYIQTHSLILIHIGSYMHAHIHTHRHTLIFIHRRTNSLILYAYAHTCTHTYTRTSLCFCLSLSLCLCH